MPKNPTTRDLSDKHENWLAEVFGGVRCPGSGNSFRNQLDLRQDPEIKFALGIDGKATRGKSLSITDEAWDKLEEQAHTLLPVMALRWYDADNTLTPRRDLVVLDAGIFAGILELARIYADLADS